MKKEYLLFLIFPISQGMILIGNYMTLGYFSTLGYVGIALGIAADIILFYVLIHGSKKEQIEKELEEVRYLKETEGMQAQMLEERKAALLSMQKDFENRLKEINERLEKGNQELAAHDIELLQEKLESTRPSSYCQNMIVNAVVSEKEKACRRLGFAMEIQLLVPSKLTLEPFHVCSIFSNLLDNAIEAVEEVEQEKRSLSVSAEMKGKYLFVKVRNASTQAHAERKKRKGRGNGTEILENLAKKYEGEYTHSYEKGYYTASVAVKAG